MWKAAYDAEMDRNTLLREQLESLDIDAASATLREFNLVLLQRALGSATDSTRPCWHAHWSDIAAPHDCKTTGSGASYRALQNKS